MKDTTYSYSFEATLSNGNVIKGIGYIQFAVSYDKADAKTIAIADVYKKLNGKEIIDVKIK